MAISKRLRIGGGVAAFLLILTAPAQAIAPQAVSGTYLEIETESDGQLASMKLWLGPDAMRMDAETQGGVSVISIGGDDGKLLMVLHQRQQYLEFTAEAMAGMAGMLGQIRPAAIEEEIADATPPTFTRTGNTKQVGEWAAYEVLVESPDQDDDMIMWFSQDVDADFRSLAEQVVTSMSSLLNSPMLRMGGGGGGGGIFGQIEAQLDAVDIPDGFPVQIISGSGGGQSISTLKAIDQNATFEAATWETPEGYTKMAMPFGR
jgi:hypothetical protein